MSRNPFPSSDNGYLAGHVGLLSTSFRLLLGKSLLDDGFDEMEAARRLFHAPFAVVSHGTEEDPIFNYGNLKALELFELSWEELTSLPSRLSAGPVDREERQRLLEAVSAKGYIENYSGVRISKTGKRFRIENAVVWNLLDGNDVYCGQAARFDEWTYL
ncbi:MAG: MEKHLA domain-containing protein [Gammaproteobacteria bacterium]